MGFVDELQQSDHPRRRDYQQFTTRYEKGRPDEGYDSKEVARRYKQVASNADARTYRKAAHSALGRMQPAQRTQFGRMLQQQAQQRGLSASYDGQSTDPGVLADLTTQVHQQDPGLLSQLLGAVGGGGGGTSSGDQAGGSVGSIAGSVLGGGTGGAAGGLLGGGTEGVAGSLLGGGTGGIASTALGGLAGDNPVAKAALAGITSYAAKKFMDRSD